MARSTALLLRPLVDPVLSGAATLAVFYLFSDAKPQDNMAARKVAGLGAASTVAGADVDDKFIRPMMRKSA